jgi:hypothetical protein
MDGSRIGCVLRTQTSPVPHNVALAGGGWLSLALAGWCWLALAVAGCRRLLLAGVGSRGPCAADGFH